jgi:hypothetical protein
MHDAGSGVVASDGNASVRALHFLELAHFITAHSAQARRITEEDEELPVRQGYQHSSMQALFTYKHWLQGRPVMCVDETHAAVTAQDNAGVILGGDLNCRPGDFEIALLRAALPALRDAWATVHPDEAGNTSNTFLYDQRAHPHSLSHPVAPAWHAD